MDKDYYQTLNLTRAASESEIAQSYRWLALRWHPDLSKQPESTCNYYFSEISEAFEVLSCPVKRAYYDKHGWKKLTQQLYEDAGLKGGYKFGNNPREIYSRFFASTSSSGLILNASIVHKGSLFGHAFGGLNHQDDSVVQDLIVPVVCSLAELYTGQAKKVEFTRKALNLDGRTLGIKVQAKLLQIKPGYRNGTVLRFKHEGNESIQKKSSDLVFKILEQAHDLYTRNGNDLIYTARIKLSQALNCDSLQIVTLDKRKLRVSLDEIPQPSVLKQIEGEGMPVQDTKTKGSLYIKFDIQFPKSMPEEAKKELRKLLG